MVARTGFGSGLLPDFFATLFSAENPGRFAKNQPLIFLLLRSSISSSPPSTQSRLSAVQDRPVSQSPYHPIRVGTWRGAMPVYFSNFLIKLEEVVVLVVFQYRS
jgi:hypothetical protein